MAPRSRGLGRRRARSILSRLQLGPPRGGPDFKFELLPLHSQLLGQSLLVSFPPLTDMLKFSGYSYLIRGHPGFRLEYLGRGPRPPRSEALATTLGAAAVPPLSFGACGGRRAPARAGLDGWEMTLGQACTARVLAGAMCVQRFDDSLDSAIRITYRISLRSSSMPEPRDPLLKVVIVIQCHKGIQTVQRHVLCGSRPAGTSRPPLGPPRRG